MINSLDSDDLSIKPRHNGIDQDMDEYDLTDEEHEYEVKQLGLQKNH
jgi:hypothetical protein